MTTEQKSILDNLNHSFNELTKRRLLDLVEQLSLLQNDIYQLNEGVSRRVSEFIYEIEEFILFEKKRLRRRVDHLTNETEDILANFIEKGEKNVTK